MNRQEAIQQIFKLWLVDGARNTKKLTEAIEQYDAQKKTVPPHVCDWEEFKTISASFCRECGKILPF